jgi:hypothetical protein
LFYPHITPLVFLPRLMFGLSPRRDLSGCTDPVVA